MKAFRGCVVLGVFLAIAFPVAGVERVILDVDPGNDDALAMLLALGAPNLHVEAVTVCPGNMGPNTEQQVRNALFVVDLAGRSGKVPVHAGVPHSILNRPYPIASFIHGKFGLGRFEVVDVLQKVDPEHAVDAIIRIVHAAPGKVTIAALGSLTNVATSMLKDPTLAKNLKSILAVGGHYATPGMAPGYNMMVDPEAADIVLRSGVPLTFVGRDVFSNDSILLDEDFEHIAAFGTKLGRFFIESNDLRRTFEKANRGMTGSTNPDPIAIATLIDPAIAKRYVSLYMHVELKSDTMRGLLVFGDNRYSQEPTPPPNVRLCVEASNSAFKQMVFKTLAQR
jgi:inosine-uridine nucleoside N-ribohydrolase